MTDDDDALKAAMLDAVLFGTSVWYFDNDGNVVRVPWWEVMAEKPVEEGA